MSPSIPIEIFHRILCNFLIMPQASQRLLSSTHHLQEDRQVCYYALRDFRNSRLVCRLWNKWLLEDFEFWRHLRVNSMESLGLAKEAISRFEGYPFHIRVTAEPDPNAEKMFMEDNGSDSGSEDSESNDSSEEEEPDKDGDSTRNAVSPSDKQNEEATAEAFSAGGSAVAGESAENRASSCRNHSHEIESGTPSGSASQAWIEEAVALLLPVIPFCEGIHLHLLTQLLHSTLEIWSFSGAPKLRHCTLEAIDYDGRNIRDVIRYEDSAQPRAHKPPVPPVKCFFKQSPLLSSVTIMNYYVPTGSPDDIGFDLKQLVDFSLVYDRKDAPLIGPIGPDVADNLLLPCISNKCINLTLSMSIDRFAMTSARLRGRPTLEKVAFGPGHFIYHPASHDQTKLPIDVGEDSNLLFRTLVLYFAQVWIHHVKRPGPTETTMLQYLIEEMPNLESLYMDQVKMILETNRVNSALYVPPETMLPRLTTILINGGNITMTEVVALIKRTPNLEKLTVASMISDKIDVVTAALGTIDESNGAVLCPMLRHLQILHSDFADENIDDSEDEDYYARGTRIKDKLQITEEANEDNLGLARMTRDLYVALKLMEIKRFNWATLGCCVQLHVRITHQVMFYERCYEDMM
ncbi:hypothetical protein SISNIDRAFT_459184 [Sistotremastrum niveocremeum HHB9708]|uniref:F-box domain-containing protein n=1 Tax=Sistotremastrum niveocremeum HHB9708 TaxID=1314777 RepID=A0A164PRN9_9AGAM|nr:hypothetical protein SISNIDRAFT_459184 [Sistotremastrum niveocremeum HHB9708]